MLRVNPFQIFITEDTITRRAEIVWDILQENKAELNNGARCAREEFKFFKTKDAIKKVIELHVELHEMAHSEALIAGILDNINTEHKVSEVLSEFQHIQLCHDKDEIFFTQQMLWEMISYCTVLSLSPFTGYELANQKEDRAGYHTFNTSNHAALWNIDEKLNYKAKLKALYRFNLKGIRPFRIRKQSGKLYNNIMKILECDKPIDSGAIKLIRKMLIQKTNAIKLLELPNPNPETSTNL